MDKTKSRTAFGALRKLSVLALAGVVLAGNPASAASAVESVLVETDTEVPAVDPVIDSVREALRILDDHRLKINPENGHERIVEDVFRLSDPGAFLVATNGVSGGSVAGASVYGIGVRVSRSNGAARIVQVLPDSPAAEEGLEEGDRILGVNGTSILDLDIAEIMRLLRGSSPGMVALLIGSRGGEDSREVELERGLVPVPDVDEEVRMPTHLHYLRVNRLDLDTGSRVLSTLTTWVMEKSGGVVLDLRGAGGTNVQSAVEIASSMVISNTWLFSYRNGDDEDLEVYHSRGSMSLDMPLMVLADRYTTGAAELLAMILAGVGRGAMVIGEITSGDPIIRETISMRDGDQIRIATRKLVTGNGDTYFGREALRPDIQVKSKETYSEYEPGPPLLTDPRGTGVGEKETKNLHDLTKGDAVLTRAVDVLLGLRALNIRSYDHGDSLDR